MDKKSVNGSTEHAGVPVETAATDLVAGLLAERVARAAKSFCEELQEDAEGLPQEELATLNDALDGWDGSAELPGGPYDDSQPVLVALSSLASDPHATDHQRRVAHLAFVYFTEFESNLDRELRRWQDAIRDKFISFGVPDSLIDGAGCDSGDPLDFTLAEVMQGTGYFMNQLEAIKPTT